MWRNKLCAVKTTAKIPDDSAHAQWCCLSVRERRTTVEREHCLPLCHAPDDLAQATVTKIWLYCACYS